MFAIIFSIYGIIIYLCDEIDTLEEEESKSKSTKSIKND